MLHKKGDNVYVNYNDGVMKVEILEENSDSYRIKIADRNFTMKENEVSSKPNKIKGVSAFRSASCGAEET